jgi:hypothetical protein
MLPMARVTLIVRSAANALRRMIVFAALAARALGAGMGKSARWMYL